MRISDLDGKRVALWGWGREARAAHAALRSRLPALRLTAICSEAEGADVRALGDPLLQTTTAADAEALSAFDVVVKSPGISPYRDEVAAAHARGTVFTSGTALWFAERPDAKVIAITGTKGKSTTSAMTAHIARALGVRTALAGNIGLPLLELLDADADLWVVELSSFQTAEPGSCAVGVVTNLFEEHLDWHGTRERYASDKLRLADAARTLVVNGDQPELLARTAAHPHRLCFGGDDGWHLHGESLCRGADVLDAGLRALTHLPGRHNALDACAALAALDALFAFDASTARAAVRALASYRPLPHRLHLLGSHDGWHWIDDSISTTPEATLAALRSQHGRAVTAILGGFERGIDWTDFAAFALRWPSLRIVTQGGNGARIAAVLHEAGFPPSMLHEVATLAEAVAVARRITPIAGVILLSPGAPSFDQFKDYAARGCEFARLAGFDPALIASIQGMGIA